MPPPPLPKLFFTDFDNGISDVAIGTLLRSSNGVKI